MYSEAPITYRIFIGSPDKNLDDFCRVNQERLHFFTIKMLCIRPISLLRKGFRAKDRTVLSYVGERCLRHYRQGQNQATDRC